MFDVAISWRIELISHLPDYILQEVEDVRVLALGYASKRVKTLLKDYCKKLRREYICEYQPKSGTMLVYEYAYTKECSEHPIEMINVWVMFDETK